LPLQVVVSATSEKQQEMLRQMLEDGLLWSQELRELRLALQPLQQEVHHQRLANWQRMRHNKQVDRAPSLQMLRGPPLKLRLRLLDAR
jgi:hypothetical protein